MAEHVRAPRLIAKYGRRAKSLFRLGLGALCQLLVPAALSRATAVPASAYSSRFCPVLTGLPPDYAENYGH
jgi:hypothetical protein